MYRNTKRRKGIIILFEISDKIHVFKIYRTSDVENPVPQQKLIA
jgi:hypothetical protein